MIRTRVNRRGSSLAIAMLLAIFPGSLLATTPDIPRIQAGAEKGLIQQEIELAAAYFSGRGVPRDEKLAAYWYEKAANSGDPRAQQEIGFFYQAGVGVERNPERAVQWFERAMAGGLVAAKVNLGVAYMWGLGIRRDQALAVQLFREAAEKGNGAGACYLGNSLYFGIGIPRDVNKAAHWFEVGAKLRDPQAEYDFALVLLEHPDRDAAERAVRYLRASAGAGYTAAKHQLALQIIRNAGLEAYDREAQDLLESASAEGFYKSSILLGILYRDGRGVSQDKLKAYYHFRIAELQGGESATKLLANDMSLLLADLKGTEIEALNTRAQAWMDGHDRSIEYIHAHDPGEKDFPAFALAFPESGIHAGKLYPAAGFTEDLTSGNTFLR